MASTRLFPMISVAALLLAAMSCLHAATITPDHTLATVGEEKISAAAYMQQMQLGMRQRFYHGRIPEGELQKYADEVMQQMIDRVLLLQEAKRRKLQVERQWVEEQIAGYDRQYASSERWQKERAERLPLLRTNLEQQSLLKVLQEQVRNVPKPVEKEVRAYYKSHPDKFTTPEKVHVSLILLKVEPSSPAAAWQGALDEGATIVAKLRNGHDFATLAKLHSGDASAEKGGDLGYIHKGMLAPEAQQALDAVKLGEVAEPIRVLQGVAILRLDDRTPASLNSYEKVRERASDLLARDKGEKAWQELTQGLRKKTKISIDQRSLKELTTPAEAPVTAQHSREQK